MNEEWIAMFDSEEEAVCVWWSAVYQVERWLSDSWGFEWSEIGGEA